MPADSTKVYDIFPVTTLGKLFSALLSILGIGIVAIPTGLISAAYVKDMEEEG